MSSARLVQLDDDTWVAPYAVLALKAGEVDAAETVVYLAGGSTVSARGAPADVLERIGGPTS